MYFSGKDARITAETLIIATLCQWLMFFLQFFSNILFFITNYVLPLYYTS